MVKCTVKNGSGADSDASSSRRERSNDLKRVRERGRLGKRKTVRKKTLKRPRDVPRSSNSGFCEDNEREEVEPSPSSSPLSHDPAELLISTPISSKIVALDCEMVATRRGSALAQCSILSYEGDVLFHAHVRPTDLIIDYRTKWSGVLPHHMKNAIPHTLAVKRIQEILKGKVIVGHGLTQDFQVLEMPYPKKQTRDTAYFKPLRSLAGFVSNQHPSLRNLSLALLGRTIQVGCHSSMEDARAALDLYRMHEKLWESHLVEQHWDKAVWLQDRYWPVEIEAQC